MHVLTRPPGAAAPRPAAGGATLLAVLLPALALLTSPCRAASARPAASPADTSGRPTLYLPQQPDSVIDSDMLPLTVPGREAPTDTSLASLQRRAREQYDLGLVLEQQGAAGAAIVAYRNALRFDSTIRNANYRMGRLYLGAGQIRPAIECLAGEITKHPDHIDARRELGLALARGGQAEQGIAQLDRLVTMNPRDEASWHALAFAYQAADRPRDAERALRRAIALPPPGAEKHRDLGAVLAGQHRDAEARAEYARALALMPGDPTTWYDLGNLERRAGHRDSALACYRRAQRADSVFRLAWQMEVQTLLDAGREAEAAASYRRWLEAMPAEHGARVEAIQLFEKLGRPEVALELARAGVRDVPDEGESYQILGSVLASQGQSRSALEQLRLAEAQYGDDAAKRAGIEAVIARMRAGAPDSLRSMYAADSVAAAKAAPTPRKPAAKQP